MAFGSEEYQVDHEAEAAEQADIASEVVEPTPQTDPALTTDPDPEADATTPENLILPDAEVPQEAPVVEEPAVSSSEQVAPSVEDENGEALPVSGALVETVTKPDAPPTSPVAPAPPEATVTVKRIGDEPVNIAIAGYQIDLTEVEEQDEVPESVAEELKGSDLVEVVE
jgi:hypothetical protein